MASDTSSRLPTWLQRIWHFTDHIRWMDPLPAPHRRGIVAALLVMLVAFLWPASTLRYPVEQPVAPQTEKEVPMQADIYENNSSRQPSSSPSQQTPKADSQGEWRNLTIASVRRWRSCFVIIVCRSMMCLRWRGWKAAISHSAH